MQTMLQATQQLQQQEPDHACSDRQPGQAPQHPQGQLQIAGDLHRQYQTGRQCGHIGQQRGRRQGCERTVEDAHRRHATQAQQWWQSEAEQQQQSDPRAGQRRHRFGQRQALRHQAAQHLHQSFLRRHAQADADRTGRHGQHQQLQGQASQNVALACTQAAQDRHLVDATQGEPVGRQCGGHASQQYRQQCAQAEETTGQVEGLAHTALGIVHAEQAHAFHLRQQPLPE
ncbi:hypothetical protein D3C73_1013970 [compost metagenome]